MNPADLWSFLLPHYLLTVAIEAPILLLGLSAAHSIPRRLVAGVWLTACTYPIVVLVMPLVFRNAPRGVYLAVAETFAPVAECAIFWAAFQRGRGLTRGQVWRDWGVITVANLASFLVGEWMNARS
ncbi:MAG TPA: hypothetical protein VK986_01440 [Tepidisphaeraceae bacterium]|nr:hypothetical protein [Tepidisphaeraceae bacterium]